jgi:hypothetical protein
MLAAFGADSTEYVNALDAPKGDTARQHVFDLRWWLSRPFTTRDLIADLPLPDEVDLHALLTMLERGREEIGAMLDRCS